MRHAVSCHFRPWGFDRAPLRLGPAGRGLGSGLRTVNVAEALRLERVAHGGAKGVGEADVALVEHGVRMPRQMRVPEHSPSLLDGQTPFTVMP